MKKIIFLFLLFPLFASSTIWYVHDGVSGNGTEATPWNLSQQNTSADNGTIQPNDSIAFKRGSVFGYLITTAGSNLSNLVKYGAYGTGANPLFTGMTTVTTWTHAGGNVWYANLDVGIDAVRMVTVNGQRYHLGRTPNTGYSYYESHSGNTSITDNQLSGTPDWDGAEVVIRKNVRWELDRHPITDHTGTTITYGASTWGSGPANPANNNGYFLQNHINMVDTTNEYFHSTSFDRLYIYSVTNPNTLTVKASTLSATPINYIHSFTRMSNLDFEGANMAISGEGGQNHAYFFNCNFSYQADYAFIGTNSHHISFINCTVNGQYNGGIAVTGGGSDIHVINSTFLNTGDVDGMHKSGEGGMIAMSFSATHNSIVQGNTVRGTGFHGIHFIGNNWLVERNRVDSVSKVVDDAGAIYTYAPHPDTIQYNRIIQDNILSNGIGNWDAMRNYDYELWGVVHGVYLDGFTNHTIVRRNTIFNFDDYGIMVNGNKDHTIEDNLSYNNRYGYSLMSYDAGRIRGLAFKRNILVAKSTYQKTLYVRRAVSFDSITNFGTIDSNYYSKPLDQTTSITVDDRVVEPDVVTNYNLAGWKTLSGVDAASQTGSLTATTEADFRFDYNYSPEEVSVSITGSRIDARGNIYTGSISVPAYSGIVTTPYVVAGGKIIKSGSGKLIKNLSNKLFKW